MHRHTQCPDPDPAATLRFSGVGPGDRAGELHALLRGIAAHGGWMLEATTALSLVPDNGWISHGWCVAEGDPEGAYRIEVSRGDTLLHAFDFQLQRAP